MQLFYTNYRHNKCNKIPCAEHLHQLFLVLICYGLGVLELLTKCY